MATLTVSKFDRPDGASLAVRRLKELQDEGLIVLHDAAYVEWPVGRNLGAAEEARLREVFGQA